MGKKKGRRPNSPGHGPKLTNAEKSEFREARRREQAIGLLLSKSGWLATSSDRDFAASLKYQYETKGHLSEMQWPYVLTLADKITRRIKVENQHKNVAEQATRRVRDHKKRQRQEISSVLELVDDDVNIDNDTVYLYAIQMDEAVKIGISNNPARRLASLQTSSPKILRLVWAYNAGDRRTARRIESQLHRRFKVLGYWLTGEWFSAGILSEIQALKGNPAVLEGNDSDAAVSAFGAPSPGATMGVPSSG